MKLKRPVLLGGLGLTAGLWMLDVWQQTVHIEGTLILGTVAVSSGLWWLNRRQQPQLALTIPQQVLADRDAVDRALTRVDSLLETVIGELPDALKADESAPVWLSLEAVKRVRSQILSHLDREALTLTLAGHKGTGKTALLNYLQRQWSPQIGKPLTWTETPEGQSVDGETDLVLFLINGDLTASEQQALQTLIQAGHQVLLVFNKQDQLLPMDRELVLERVRSRVGGMGVGVVEIATVPNPIKVRRHLATGEVEEFLEQPVPATTALSDHLTPLLTENASQLVMATALRQAQALQRDTLSLLNQQRRQRALPLIEKMQWLAAATAFANPLATLDLLAALAINAQLILDLGAIYGQPFSLTQAKTAAATLAELTVKLGLVELSTQVLGSLLKSHATTYVAGGVLQGVSAAYLTRLVGQALIEFFEEQSLAADRLQAIGNQSLTTTLNVEQLSERLQTLFQQAHQGLALQNFVTQALQHLPIGNPPSSTPTANATLMAEV